MMDWGEGSMLAHIPSSVRAAAYLRPHQSGELARQVLVSLRLAVNRNDTRKPEG